jgi:hypothetical protein
LSASQDLAAVVSNSKTIFIEHQIIASHEIEMPYSQNIKGRAGCGTALRRDNQQSIAALRRGA